MKKLMENLFFKYFKEISDIPRQSGNEKKISDYLVEFAKQRNLEVIQDEYLNIIIKKKATKGYEKVPGIILQGHMDMVCVKNIDSNHNFEKDPIRLQVIGDKIYATDTTLGADDGVALAYSLAILDSNNLNHPMLEIVMTTQEETTMNGAINLDISALNGKTMINLDSNRDDELLVSSTGGIIINQILNIEWVNLDERYLAYEICVGGLIGGHSGEEIHKQRGNANKILAKVLDNLNKTFDIYINDINGGTSSNAIAREAKAVIYIYEEQIEQIENLLKDIEKEIQNEFKIVDDKVTINIQNKNISSKKVFSKKNVNDLIDAIILMPDGVQSMSNTVEGLVESSNNVGTIRRDTNKVTIESEIRSCVKSKRYDIESKIEKISKLLNLNYSTRDPYPEWNYNDQSIIQNVFKDSYKELLNKDINIKAVHSGLETGIFIERIPKLDIIAYGPNAYELHNPKEHLYIDSCFKAWDVLVKTLENTIKYY